MLYKRLIAFGIFSSCMIATINSYAIPITSIWVGYISRGDCQTNPGVLPGIKKIMWSIQFDDGGIGIIDGSSTLSGKPILVESSWSDHAYYFDDNFLLWTFDNNLQHFFDWPASIEIFLNELSIYEDGARRSASGGFDTGGMTNMGRAYTDNYYPLAALSEGWFNNGELAYYGGEGRNESLYVYNVSASFYHGVDNLPKPVPEPSTMLFFGTGLLSLAGSNLRRQKSLRSFSTHFGERA